jgi:hypothetical protein
VPSAAYDEAVSGLRSGKEQSALGNRPAALKALTYAQSKLPLMTVAERGEMQSKIAAGFADASRIRTPQEIAAGKAAFESRVAAQQAEARGETGGAGGEWWSPGAWFPSLASRPGETSAVTKIVWLVGAGVGLYGVFKLLGFISEGRRYKVDRERLGVERERVRALSNNPRRRRRR